MTAEEERNALKMAGFTGWNEDGKEASSLLTILRAAVFMNLMCRASLFKSILSFMDTILKEVSAPLNCPRSFTLKRQTADTDIRHLYMRLISFVMLLATSVESSLIDMV